MTKLPDGEASLWRDFYPDTPLYPRLSEEVTVDVAVVGAGITGLTAAYQLKQAGLTVAVVEKHTVGGGTSGRTTGKVTSQHNLHYATMQKRFGADITAAYGRANEEAIQHIDAVIARHEIECDWDRDDHYVYTTDKSRLSEFRREAIAAAAAGLPASFEADPPLPFGVTASVRFTDQAKINTQKYLLGLARIIAGSGSYIFENSTAIGIRDGSRCRILTATGRVFAKNIIVASSVPTMPLIARGTYSVHEYPSESYIIAGVPGVPLRGMYISPDEHNYSLLPVKVDGSNILLVGGEGHFWGLRGNRQARFVRLADFAGRHFDVSAATHKWSDRDYLSYDRMPLVGKLYPWSKHMYVGTGFSKWGLTNGTAAGIILSDLIQARENPFAGIFSPRRPAFINKFRSMK